MPGLLGSGAFPPKKLVLSWPWQGKGSLAASWASFPSLPDLSYKEYSGLFLTASFLLCVETGGNHSIERGQSEEEGGQRGVHRTPKRENCDLDKVVGLRFLAPSSLFEAHCLPHHLPRSVLSQMESPSLLASPVLPH